MQNYIHISNDLFQHDVQPIKHIIDNPLETAEPKLVSVPSHEDKLDVILRPNRLVSVPK